MNKFGLLDEDDADSQGAVETINQKLATFSPVRPRPVLDVAASDAAAAQHGFTSREPAAPSMAPPAGRRRRAIPAEPTRHLAIRLSFSGYDRFVAYADREKLTYHEALLLLMDRAGV